MRSGEGQRGADRDIFEGDLDGIQCSTFEGDLVVASNGMRLLDYIQSSTLVRTVAVGFNKCFAAHCAVQILDSSLRAARR